MDEREKGAGTVYCSLIPWNTWHIQIQPVLLASCPVRVSGQVNINYKQESDWCSMKCTEGPWQLRHRRPEVAHVEREK